MFNKTNSNTSSVQIMWFKRDLRVVDNRAFFGASQNGDVIPLYIFEPDLWKQPDMSHRHFTFLTESLKELNNELVLLGQPLIIRIGNAVDILNQLTEQYQVKALWSHQETWNLWTYDRDKRVKKWTKEKQILWNEPAQNGVVRCLKDRDGWAYNWYKEMNKTITIAPKKLTKINIISDLLPSSNEFNLFSDGLIYPQKGGRKKGLELLDSFLYARGKKYTKEMSSPVTAFESCSRISVHLAFGTISMREVFQKTEQRYQEIKQKNAQEQAFWLSAMRSFLGRLRWHCHFIQKLEDQPRIEFENMHSLYNGLREDEFNEQFFNAWKSGETGYPIVDACMRCLIATGWLNFRMRAMLMSFASYHLWLHWRETAIYLARLFTDYEPGIHYSQVQMQSGTTGINAIRIYNPIKQALDQDPDGVFIKQWIPELAHLPIEFIHVPWKFSGNLNYPKPIIDEKEARGKAAAKIYNLRKNVLHKEESKLIVKKHGSRKKTPSTKALLSKKVQLNLF